jgi:hypothetical protein
MYEKAQDLENEKRAQAIVEAAWGAEVRKTQAHANWDWEIYKDGKLLALGEVKKRNNAHDKYATYHIALDKVRRGMDASKARGVRFVIFVQFIDGLYRIDTKAQPIHHIEEGGRFDRGDKFDVEQMAHYKVSQMKQIK